ncbi:hypothetical protein DsansV1_C22g0170971 [Dioscorea sansibarensis]
MVHNQLEEPPQQPSSLHLSDIFCLSASCVPILSISRKTLFLI